jgi:oligopeptide transport system ATP-binding protein
VSSSRTDLGTDCATTSAAPRATSRRTIFEIQDLCCTYYVQNGIRATEIQAVRNVDLNVYQGEMLAVVGESGSGKSTLGRTLVRLEQPSGGRALFDGADIARLKGKDLVKYRGDVQIVFQNPYQSLNPKLTVGSALAEVLTVWSKRRPGVKEQTVERLLAGVHLPRHYEGKYPHELSGGERQRVAIARAIAVRPRVVVADEPVSALDVGASARVLNLLLELQQELDLTCLFITHDIGLARIIADRIAVMYLGQLVDVGPPEQVFTRPSHDYTRALIAAQLKVSDDAKPPRIDDDLDLLPPDEV